MGTHHKIELYTVRHVSEDGVVRYPRLTEEDFAEEQDEAEAEYLALLEREQKDKVENLAASYFPDKGPFRRELYPKHIEFIHAGGKHEPMSYCPEDCEGKPHRERCVLAGNRCGKSDLGAYEMTMHLTGDYPSWWKGRRFEHPILAWAAGDTSQTTRDIIQLKLLGPFGAYGTGMIPRKNLIHTTTKSGIPHAVETIWVRHISGGRSELSLKSFDQGRLSFQGTKRHFIWLDEECPEDIYTECLLRTMDCDGQVILTFTPLNGLTNIVRSYMGLELLDNEDKVTA